MDDAIGSVDNKVMADIGETIEDVLEGTPSENELIVATGKIAQQVRRRDV